MKTVTSAKELSSRIAEKLGLSYEAETYEDLARFVEEVVPAIGEEFAGGRPSFEDFWIPFNDDSPLPFWQITADKQTISCILQNFSHKDAFDAVAFYAGESDSEDLGDLPDEGEIVADLCPNGRTADVLKWLRAFSEEHSLSFSFRFYNLYPLCSHFEKKLGQDANEIVWRIENGKISTDGQEIVVTDGAEGDLFLVQCWWLKDLELEALKEYGLRVALETADDAPKTWKMLDCGMSDGLRIKYGK